MAESPLPMKEGTGTLQNFLHECSPDKDQQLSLGYIWGIVLKQASKGGPIKSPRRRYRLRRRDASRSSDPLLIWAIDRTKGYRGVENFQPIELAFLALLDTFVPSVINFDKIDPRNRLQNARKLFTLLNELEVGSFLFPEEVPDDYDGRVDKEQLLAQIMAIKAKYDPEDLDSSGIKPRAINFITDEEEDEYELELQRRREEEEERRRREEEEERRRREEEEERRRREEEERKQRELDELFSRSKKIDGDNSQYMGRRFAMLMTFVDEYKQRVTLALKMDEEQKPYLNPAGIKLILAPPNFENDKNQHFVFGQVNWTTVIDSCVRQGMVWDVANWHSLDPPPGTEFYLFPFHGRHNQHFIYRDGHIFAQQNGHVVTYVGGEKPLVMQPLQEGNERQIFQIILLDEDE